jgi:hypothetical protein
MYIVSGQQSHDITLILDLQDLYFKQDHDDFHTSQADRSCSQQETQISSKE